MQLLSGRGMQEFFVAWSTSHAHTLESLVIEPLSLDFKVPPRSKEPEPRRQKQTEADAHQ